jgi:soluble lytic murein transglycosylase-like protein
MKKFELVVPHQWIRLPRVLNAGLLFVLLIFVTTGAMAQSATPAPAATSTQTENATTAAPKSYAEGLKELSALQEQEAQRLAQQNEKLKQAFADGLVSRNDMEAGDKSLAEARARVEATQKQIAAAALKPAPVTVAANTLTDGSTNESWTSGNNRIDNLIRYYGGQIGLDPFLIFCLMNQESGFAARATSPKGARGLMQLMPATAARYGVRNPYDAAQSISAGSRYLKDLLQMFNGRLDLALAGYNAGEGAVIKYGYQIPPYSETRNYVRLISARYEKKNGVSKKI